MTVAPRRRVRPPRTAEVVAAALRDDILDGGLTVLPRIENRASGKFVTIPAEAGYYLTERRF